MAIIAIILTNPYGCACASWGNDRRRQVEVGALLAIDPRWWQRERR
ncbi:MAG: hypothetical protein HPY76_06975 [Anaerolineae bacterium]|nr:hypothetical protein [Anaerolineae bacterium]